MRYTKSDVELAFTQAMRVIGGDYNPDKPNSLYAQDADTGNWRCVVGRYALDYAACYGGWRIVRAVNEQGGLTDVTRRMPARQFCEALRVLCDLDWERQRSR